MISLEVGSSVFVIWCSHTDNSNTNCNRNDNSNSPQVSLQAKLHSKPCRSSAAAGISTESILRSRFLRLAASMSAHVTFRVRCQNTQPGEKARDFKAACFWTPGSKLKFVSIVSGILQAADSQPCQKMTALASLFGQADSLCAKVMVPFYAGPEVVPSVEIPCEMPRAPDPAGLRGGLSPDSGPMVPGDCNAAGDQRSGAGLGKSGVMDLVDLGLSHVCVSVSVCVCVCVCVSICFCVYVYAYIHRHRHTHAHIQAMSMYMSPSLSMSMSTSSLCISMSMSVFMSTCRCR